MERVAARLDNDFGDGGADAMDPESAKEFEYILSDMKGLASTIEKMGVDLQYFGLVFPNGRALVWDELDEMSKWRPPSLKVVSGGPVELMGAEKIQAVLQEVESSYLLAGLPSPGLRVVKR